MRPHLSENNDSMLRYILKSQKIKAFINKYVLSYTIDFSLFGVKGQDGVLLIEKNVSNSIQILLTITVSIVSHNARKTKVSIKYP